MATAAPIRSVYAKGRGKEPFKKRRGAEAVAVASFRFVYAKGRVKEPFKKRRGEEAADAASFRFVYAKGRGKGTVLETEVRAGGDRRSHPFRLRERKRQETV